MASQKKNEMSWLMDRKDRQGAVSKKTIHQEQSLELLARPGRASNRYPQMEDENLEAEFWNS